MEEESVEFTIDLIGTAVWAASCVGVLLFLIIYDGFYKNKVHVILGMFICFLLCQAITSGLFIANHYVDSAQLRYLSFVLLTLAADMYVLISNVLILTPLHHNKLLKITALYILPTIFIIFLIILLFIPPRWQSAVVYVYHIPCAIYSYISLIILTHWYRKQKFIFAVYLHSYNDLINPHLITKWKLLFSMALVSVTIGGIINFIYRPLAVNDIFPDEYLILWIRISDAVILFFYFPLIRGLDKLNDYSRWRIIQYDNMDNVSDNDIEMSSSENFSHKKTKNESQTEEKSDSNNENGSA